MCNFFSALGFRDGTIRHHWALDSHSDLMIHWGVADDADYQSKFVKLELAPADDTWLEPEKWKFTVDEPSSPVWCDDERTAEFRSAMVSAAKRMIITGEKRLIVDGCWIIGGNAKVIDVRAGRVLAVWGGQISGVRGGQISDVWGGQISGVRGGQISDVRGGQISDVRGGQISDVWGDAKISDVWGGQISDVWGDAKLDESAKAHLKKENE